MKAILCAINAKYIHANLAVRYLRAYALKSFEGEPRPGDSAPEIEIAEYTINNRTEEILADLYGREPGMVAFSCYIWNRRHVEELVRDLRQVMPTVPIWVGGPEVSFDAAEFLEEFPEVSGTMAGEGEKSFAALLRAMTEAGGRPSDEALRAIPGLVFRDASGAIRDTGPAELLPMDELPFVYGDEENLEHRIIYYESSRGCPFSCSYCLSSVSAGVRLRSISQVFGELGYFLEHRTPQVKFVDRTFNAPHAHALAIWRYIAEHDNGVTNFHFEIGADLLTEEELDVLAGMRPGLVQLEIGVQSTNGATLDAVCRTMDLARLRANVSRIHSFHNIHQHLDLIAGLPYEDLGSFRRSFNEVHAMEPDQLQLGFLKELRGSRMRREAEKYGILYRREAPYEVLETRWMPYGDLLLLKGVEEMTEVYYNSAQFRKSCAYLRGHFPDPFSFYLALAEYHRGLLDGLADGDAFRGGRSFSRIDRLSILRGFAASHPALSGISGEMLDALLLHDLYLRENSRRRPEWAGEDGSFRERFIAFFRAEAERPDRLPGYEGFDAKQMMHMTHQEVYRVNAGDFPGEGPWPVVYDYRNRDALTGNARVIVI